MVEPEVPQDAALPAPSMRARRRLGGLELLFLGVAAIVLLLAVGLSIEVRFDGRAGGDGAAATTGPTVATDVPPAPAPAPVPREPAPAVEEERPAEVTVQLLDGGGGEERVGEVRALLDAAGFRVAATNMARPMEDTIYFTVGFEAEARRAAELIGFERVESMVALPPERRLSSSVMLHVIVGAG